MDIKKQSAKFYQERDDKNEYFLKNAHGNILSVGKVILMERLGYTFLRKKDTATEEDIGRWKKILPAEEGFEVVTKEDWQDLENKRLKITPAPVEEPKGEGIKMGPDEGRLNPSADLEAEAKAKAKADAEAEAAKIADDEARAKAEADAAGNNEGGN